MASINTLTEKAEDDDEDHDQEEEVVQLGFSIPLGDPEEENGPVSLGHESVQWWDDWDGGKLGGRPSWLNPQDIPSADELHCSCASLSCSGTNSSSSSSSTPNKTPMQFIVQLYSPLDGAPFAHAFHRTLYVFGCPKCQAIRVIRCQLPRDNSFYPSRSTTNSDNDGANKEDGVIIPKKADTCVVCGQKSRGMCPIQKKGFCSTVHQKEYKKYHDNKSTGAMANLSHSILLPSLLVESELVVEEEPAEPTNSEMTREDGTNRTPLFETANDDEDDADDGDLEQTDLNEMTGATGTAVDDEVTLEFYSRMGRPNNARQQCLRYHRWPSSISNHPDENEHDEEDCGGPLWIHSQNRPTETDISPCCHCGAPRNFEFQLMPQMLHYLLPKESSSSSPSSLLDAQRKQALLVASDIVENNAKEVSDEFKQIQQETLEKVRNELLNDTNDTSRGGTLNWGVVCIYTCTSSCSSESSNNSDKRSSLGAYQEEFAWRQEPLS